LIRHEYGLRMSVVLRVSLAALLSLTAVVIGMAEDSKLKDWLAVSPQQAGIVLSIDFPVSEARIFSEGKLLAAKKWTAKPPFVWQLRVQPDIYQIQFTSGPISSVGVVAKQPASLSYVRVVPIRGNAGDVGIGVSVTSGPLPTDVADGLQNAAQIGVSDAFGTDYIEAGSRVLLVSTDPPWPIPPPPPPKR
jgi:hypothetical protein